MRVSELATRRSMCASVNNSCIDCLPCSEVLLSFSFSVFGKSSTARNSLLKCVSVLASARQSGSGGGGGSGGCVFKTASGSSSFKESPLHSSDTHDTDTASPSSPLTAFSTSSSTSITTSLTRSAISEQLELEPDMESAATLTVWLRDGADFIFFMPFEVTLWSLASLSLFDVRDDELLVTRGNLRWKQLACGWQNIKGGC